MQTGSENLEYDGVSEAVQVQDEVAELVVGEPWGFWATVGFSFAIAAGFFAFTIPLGIVTYVILVMGDSNINSDEIAVMLESNGLFLSASTFVTAIPVVGLCILFAWLRKNITIGEYLGLKKVRPVEMLKWLAVLVVFVICHDCLTMAVGQEVVPEWMVKTYSSAGFMPLLWAAIIIIAPISEEVLFRGFLFRGFAASWMGTVGAVVITSLIWAGLHGQYNLYGIAGIFVGGLLLGYARVKSGSVLVPIAMHALLNLIATVEVMVKL